MFCDKCGREIRHDSEYCSYCGAATRPTEAHPSESASGGTPKSAAEAHCVTPRAPKKHCLDCNKELPASSISDICALCTIRRRNRELEKDRVDSDAAYAKLDRYDISDEFDQTVFQGNKYYKGNPDSEPLYRQRTETPHISPFKRHESPDERKSSRKNLGFSWIAVIVVITAIGIFGNMAEFGTHKSEPTASAVVNVTNDESSMIEVGVDDLEPAAASESTSVDGAHASSDWEELPPASLNVDGSLPAMSDEGFVPASYDEVLMRVSEVTLFELNNLLSTSDGASSEISVGNGQFSYDGAYLYSKGSVFYIDGSGRETSSEVFELCTMMSRTQYLVLAASIGDVNQFDLRYAIAPDGTLTEEGAAEISAGSNPVSPGDAFFTDPVIFPGEY